MYMVTAIRDIYEESGVEIAGVFDDVEKAYEVKLKVETWMKENEYECYGVFITPVKVNHVAWYEIEEDV